ncbi:1-deoxy-D-xylulose-5-phosphate reductoisomerase [Planctobacterium marinum]|uniref:1-deoxy-D-xylulose 5-phosphate reductoisomerase n=1 Tax=Planctobacterium marinum TaxID=1631968 RepID=A0AA48HXB1_9ALTE|nr:1-deoxy-D-xylulose 5-phosphate reductoisomerase [Planctobacterium marinum]
MKPIKTNQIQNITLLGATGSIGLSTLDVVARHPERFRIFALTCHSKVEELVKLAVIHQPRHLVTSSEAHYSELQKYAEQAGLNCEVHCGIEALCAVSSAPDVNTVMAAIVGAAGLLPTFSAVTSGKKVLLANKESLVMSGKLFMDAVAEHNATLLPVDSEHNAIFQCLPEQGYCERQIRKILLTGSGGPFLKHDISTFTDITPEQACKHPNWSMGQKISVDSATMMNKGLEFIEACHLFHVSGDNIDVVIHPQSIVHSMVQYSDGSVLAQMGQPDMRTPIAHTLSWPERIESGVASLDFSQLVDLQFLKPDFERFPCLQLAIECASQGQAATTALNAANEIAVAAFLDRKIRYTDIFKVCQQTVEQGLGDKVESLDDIIACDANSRKIAAEILESI